MDARLILDLCGNNRLMKALTINEVAVENQVNNSNTTAAEAVTPQQQQQQQ